jgi:hypothetical protein
MPYFPQLSTGCLSQYPLRRQVKRRTILNQTLGGGRFVLADPDFALVEWELYYQGLTEAEMLSLQALFDSCEGSLGEFVFPDPTGNLLARSGEPNLAPWTRDPLLAWTPGIADPFGGNAAGRLTNGAAAVQTLAQSVALPGNYAYCFSFHARATAAVTVTAGWSQGAAIHTASLAVGPVWRRLETSGQLAPAASPVVFSLQLPASASVELFGLQAEAQLASSAYRRTFALSGVHLNARFAQDELTFTANGVNNYSTRVRVRARNGN